MGQVITYFTRIEGGQFTGRAVRDLMRSLEGKRVEVMIRPRRNYRTLSQNNAFHGPVLQPITREMQRLGVTSNLGPGPILAEEVKEFLKGMFLRRQVPNPITGELVDTFQDTHSMTKSDFADFMTQCIKWAEDPPSQGGLGLRIVIGDAAAEESWEVT